VPMTAGPIPLAGRYRLGELLGVGGMGRIWLARDVALDRDVAIKEIVLPAELIAAERDAVQRRTLREARAAARLSHPSVAQVYDVFEADGRTWIVMEYVPSRSLHEVIRAEGPLEPRRVAQIGLQVLAALDAAHRAGVRHRDVKPANVLLAHDGRVVLTDFGIATIEGDSIVTSSELVLGSPEYMSPERARNGMDLPASDLWSLGATLYAAVEGRSPYKRGSVMETVTALAADEPDPPQRAGALRPVLEGLLRKDPAARIDVAETQRRLRSAATGDRAHHLRWPWGAEPKWPASQATESARQSEHAAPASVAAPPATPMVPRQRVPQRSPGPAVAVEPADEADTHPAATPGPTKYGRRPAVAAAAAVLVVAGAAATWLAVRPDEGDAGRDASRSTSTASVSPAQTVSPESTDQAGGSPAPAGEASDAGAGQPVSGGGATRQRPALPPGWRDYRDPTGFSVYVPAGWKRSREGSIVYFRDARTGRVLGVDQTDKPQWNPVADWRGKASYRVGRGDFPGYHEIHIVAVPYFRKAADWEFTFNGRVRQHVNNRGFVVSKTQAYGIYWQTSDAGWAAARSDLQLIFDSFRPATR
jgi:hypothetical protein